jgi:PAS domain S-box-containing protein
MNLEVEKDPGIIPLLLTQILDNCVNGITLSDPDLPDNPVVYANEVFRGMTGYSEDEIVGRNCRFLQGPGTEAAQLERLREGIRDKKAVEVVLTNYRKNGSAFPNRLTVRPLFDRTGRLIYFLGIQYDMTDIYQARMEAGKLSALLHPDEAQDTV